MGRATDQININQASVVSQNPRRQCSCSHGATEGTAYRGGWNPFDPLTTDVARLKSPNVLC
jgi:hypothetical protein